MQVLALTLTVLAWCWCCSLATITIDNRKVKTSATKGMVIDAGSGGSRLHVYSWQPRKFSTVPPPLSYPEGDEQWTSRIAPGIASFADDLDLISSHLAPLIEFAKRTLIQFKGSYQDFPIYFYATGGMRELDPHRRELVISKVRKFLHNDEHCPFFFKDDFARIISGEEEAIFSWAATNFLMGTLLPASQGLGIVTDVNDTYGTVDLGGASTQIAYFLPSQDIMEGLYKFQLGSQKQWNVYTKSFLQFGVNSVRTRYLTGLVDEFLGRYTGSRAALGQKIVTSCFHAGYGERVRDSYGTHYVEVTGPELPQADQLDRCMQELRPLMERKYNTFCDEVYHGDCSIAGSYQPPLPGGEHGRFIGTSSLNDPWKFLQLPPTASLDLVAEKASSICQMNFDDISFYYETNALRFGGDASQHFSSKLPYFCFLSGYIFVLLKDGYRFQNSQTLTVVEEVHGNSMGWALGAILYEINELPFDLKTSVLETHLWIFIVFAAVVGFIVGSIAAVLVYREVIEAPHGRYTLIGDGSAGTAGISSSSTGSTSTYDDIKRVNTIDRIRRSTGTGTGLSSNSQSHSGEESNGHSQHQHGVLYDSEDLHPDARSGTPISSSSGGEEERSSGISSGGGSSSGGGRAGGTRVSSSGNGSSIYNNSYGYGSTSSSRNGNEMTAQQQQNGNYNNSSNDQSSNTSTWFKPPGILKYKSKYDERLPE